MQHDYHRDSIQDLLKAGTQPDEDFYRVQATGKGSTHWLNVSADQLRNLADAMDETNPPSLLPLMNGHRVIMAETWFNRDGIGEGIVLAENHSPGSNEWVTWHVYLHVGEVRWIAEHGDYHRDLFKAKDAYYTRCSEVKR